tara:strand:+ start:1269 stop:2387 length:1119 start_codon:yes stop_codon:yes gene_type:complete
MQLARWKTLKTTSSYYKCSAFRRDLEVTETFDVEQEELVVEGAQKFLQAHITNLKSTQKSIRATKNNITYSCQWSISPIWTKEKPVVIIPIKDNLDLLSVTIKNLQNNNIDKHCNIIIVDDRSNEDIKKIVLKNSLSYLRVDNEKGFNFSMLNNIAAKIAHSLGASIAILWNSDLWCVKEEWFEQLMQKHIQSKSVLSTTKLVYPPIALSLNKEEDNQNMRNHFPQMLGGKWRETVQFGGDAWGAVQGYLRLSPMHSGRFSSLTDPFVDCDRPCRFATGALHIWDLHKFIEIGGLNPTLAKNFQDVDICLRLVEAGIAPQYFGKDIYFYHDESYTLTSKSAEPKYNNSFFSDQIIFGKIWNDKLAALVLGLS